VNLEKVIFGFVTVYACTLNFVFYLGDSDRPDMHHAWGLYAAIIVNLIALVLKFGDRTQLGATHLATSLVANLQLLAASLVWLWTVHLQGREMDAQAMSVIVSLSGGALLANLLSVTLLIGETLRQGPGRGVSDD
jgi:hypothetical protein